MKKTVLILILICAVACGLVTPTMSMYSQTIDLKSPTIVGEVENHVSYYEAVDYLKDLVFNTKSLVYKYFVVQNPVLNNKSLDSSGKNFGMPISVDLVANFGLVDKTFAFCIYHYFDKRYEGAKKYDDIPNHYYDVYFANVDITGWASGSRIDYVVRYDSKNNVYYFGSAYVYTDKTSGVLASNIDVDTFVAEGVLNP